MQMTIRSITTRIITMMLAFTLVAGPAAACAGSIVYADDSAYTRLSGKDRYDTSIAIADELKAELGGSFDAVVVASGDNYPDALSGGYLAYVKKAPLLIVSASSETKIITYIKNNLASDGCVYILGGTGVVSPAFENKIAGSGYAVKRLGGPDRYTTNMLILKEARNELLTQRDDVNEQLTADREELDAVSSSIDTLEEKLAKESYARDQAKTAYESALKVRKSAEDALLADGIDVYALKQNISTAQAKVDNETANWKAAQSAANTDLNNKKAIAAKPGWYFINSKVSGGQTIDYWVNRAKSYSGTSSTANGSTFASNLNDATTVANLKKSADFITTCSSKRGSTLAVDYNLMASSVVSASLLGANTSAMLDHRFSYKVVDPYYSYWNDECLAYGSANPFSIWYDYEKPKNGPHYRVIIKSGIKSAGFGWSTPKKASSLQVGTRTSGTVSVNEFKTQLTNYANAAASNLTAAQNKVNALKTEPAALKTAKSELAAAKDAYEQAGLKYGFDLDKIYSDEENAKALYDKEEAACSAMKSELDADKQRKETLVDEIVVLEAQLEEVLEKIKAADPKDDELVVCSGTGFADSLSASAIRKPILLVNNSISAEQLKYINRYESSKLYIIGGTGAVAQNVEDAIRSKCPGFNVIRVSGLDRFKTSAAVAETFFGNKVDAAVITYGMNFPDGLSGGPLAAVREIPLLLVNNSSTEARTYVTAHEAADLVVLGGTGVIPDSEAASMIFEP